MKYTISEDRVYDLIDKYMKNLVPNFSFDGTVINRGKYIYDIPYVNYYDRETLQLYASYFPEYGELRLNKEIYNSLYGLFGDNMILLVSWFNKEFNERAQFVVSTIE